MPALSADMMRTLLLAAIRALVVRRRRELVVRPAHVPLGRRRFSLGDRHGGSAPSKAAPASGTATNQKSPRPNRPSLRPRDAPASLEGAGKTRRGVNPKRTSDSSAKSGLFPAGNTSPYRKDLAGFGGYWRFSFSLPSTANGFSGGSSVVAGASNATPGALG